MRQCTMPNYCIFDHLLGYFGFRPDDWRSHVSRHILDSLLTRPVALKIVRKRIARHRARLPHKFNSVLYCNSCWFAVCLEYYVAAAKFFYVPDYLPEQPLVSDSFAGGAVRQEHTRCLVFSNNDLLLYF